MSGQQLRAPVTGKIIEAEYIASKKSMANLESWEEHAFKLGYQSAIAFMCRNMTGQCFCGCHNGTEICKK